MIPDLGIHHSFIRARQLEGTYPGPKGLGVWGVNYNRILFGWGQVEEGRWPEDWEEKGSGLLDLPGLDEDAKQHRIPYYQRVRSSEDARRVMAQLRRLIYSGSDSLPPPDLFPGLTADFEITQEFVESPLGIVELAPLTSPLVGTHSVPIIWDIREQHRFAFDNSWGPDWGVFHRGSMPYEFLDRNMVEAWCLDAREVPHLHDLGPGIQCAEWEMPDVVGRPLHAFEYYDADANDRIGWAFAAPCDGFLDVEELYVRPQYRNRGYGGKLASKLITLSDGLKMPIRLWVSFADASRENRPALTAILKRMGLAPRGSGVRWAAYQALPATDDAFHFRAIRIPARPAYSKDGAGPSKNLSLQGTVLSYPDPFGPAAELEEWEALR